uniref:Putative secreted peptide n=1 Tax=Anopheles braziliensis TaxID=58242 RepID=A0A2M3ZQ67_9DIPT
MSRLCGQLLLMLSSSFRLAFVGFGYGRVGTVPEQIHHLCHRRLAGVSPAYSRHRMVVLCITASVRMGRAIPYFRGGTGGTGSLCGRGRRLMMVTMPATYMQGRLHTVHYATGTG